MGLVQQGRTVRSLLLLSSLKLSAALLATALSTACSNYHYKDYQGD